MDDSSRIAIERKRQRGGSRLHQVVLDSTAGAVDHIVQGPPIRLLLTRLLITPTGRFRSTGMMGGPMGQWSLSTSSVISRSLNFRLVTFCGFAKRFWWELAFPTCDGTLYLHYHGGLVPRPVGERLEITAARLGVQEVVTTKALVLASRYFY